MHLAVSNLVGSSPKVLLKRIDPPPSKALMFNGTSTLCDKAYEMSENHEALHDVLEVFAPGLSWIFRMLYQALGVDILPYILPLVSLSAISTFILPKILEFIGPITLIFVTCAEIQYRDKLYPQAIRWMSDVEFSSFQGSLVISISQPFGFLWGTEDTPETDADTHELAYQGKLKKVRFTPGQEHFHFFKHKGHFFALCRHPHPNEGFLRAGEDISFYYLRWNQPAFLDLVQTIQTHYIDSYYKKIPVFLAHQCKDEVEWRQMCSEHPRSLESIAMNPAMSQSIMEDIQWYMSDKTRQLYLSRGIPRRRGLLFHGMPGTGKSTFCRVIASELRVPIYIINPASISNGGFQELFATLPSNCIVLLEDIDTAGIENRERENENSDRSESPSLGTVLNAMDGIGTHAEHVLIVTTNKRLTLDPALTRPGRIDKQYEFPCLDPLTMQRYFSFFFRESCLSKAYLQQLATVFSNLAPGKDLSPAALQNYFLQCNENPEIAVGFVNKLFASSDEAANRRPNIPVSVSTVQTSEIDIPLHRAAVNTQRVTAGTIVFRHDPDDLARPFVLLGKRNWIEWHDGDPKPNWLPGAWEVLKGEFEEGDVTVLSIMSRVLKKETGLTTWSASSESYEVHIEGKTQYICPVQVTEKGQCRRTWCHEKSEPQGSDEDPIQLRDGGGYTDYVWADRSQIAQSTPFDSGTWNQNGLVMTTSERDMLEQFFLWEGSSKAILEYPISTP